MEVYDAMQENKPFKSYIKTILGKVYINVLDSFTEQPVGLMLVGDPHKFEESSIINVWNAKEDMFLRTKNQNTFDRGVIVEYTRPTVDQPKSVDESTDEELESILELKFLALQSKLNQMRAVGTLRRILNIAENVGKSDKLIRTITARLAEVQGSSESKEA
jgi:hypothetical protein